MKLIEPKVELWSEEGVTSEEHIARCAAVCYDSRPKDPKKLVGGLIRNGHLSMLRHATRYFKFSCYRGWQLSEYISICAGNDMNRYGSVNLQFVEECGDDLVYDTPVDIRHFLELCQDEPDLFGIFRLTFCLTTQISTSRELNRVSPNNIAERSTRYCSSKNGLEICKPWWWKDVNTEAIAFASDFEKEAYNAWADAEEHYRWLLEFGMKPEDTRGVLPLDTATKVVYTYSVAEWKHILDLRYYGKTGRPHPNCKLIMGMVRDEINRFAKEHSINCQL